MCSVLKGKMAKDVCERSTGTSLPAPVVGEPSQDPDIEMDDDIAEERPEELSDSDPDLLQEHSSSSDFDDEPDDTPPQVYKTPMQGKPGEAGLLPPGRRPVRQRKPPAWMATGEWVSK